MTSGESRPWAPALALQDFSDCTASAHEGSPGTVESVRQVVLLRDIHAVEADGVRAGTAEELVVRLDARPLVVFTERKPHPLSAGQRVRVQLNGSIARVERDSSECATPLAGRKPAKTPG